MAQLQLYTTKNQRGYKHLVNINPSEDVLHHVHDYSGALEMLRYDAGTAQYFYLLRYIESGLMFVILRPVPGDNGDHYAATLYVPAGMRIDAAEFLDVVESVKLFLDGSDPTTLSISDMRARLAKDYAVDADAAMLQPTTGHHYAYTLYGGHETPSLGDYASLGFYQPDYCGYGGVLLLDARGLARTDARAADLTRLPLTELTRVDPPSKSLQGFTAYLGRHQFTSPILAGVGSVLNINWHKGGFETIQAPFTVTPDNPTPPIPDTSASRRVITPATFYISEDRGRQSLPGNFNIKVNGVDIDSPKAFTYDDLKNARVDITAPGYVAFSGHFDLAATTQVQVQMHALHKTYRFDLPLNTPEPSEAVKIYVKTRKTLTKCPVEGYSVTGDKIAEGPGVTNLLVYTGGRERRGHYLVAIAAGVGLLVGLLAGWLCGRTSQPAVTEPAAPVEVAQPERSELPERSDLSDQSDRSDKSDESDLSDNNQPADTAEAPVMPGEEAIAYLEDNKTWRRAEMEAIAGLQGLFDDMNSYNFGRITEVWGPRLEKSKHFAAVVRAAKGAPVKRDPHKSPHDPVYDPDNTSIGWLSYTYWIDP